SARSVGTGCVFGVPLDTVPAQVICQLGRRLKVAEQMVFEGLLRLGENGWRERLAHGRNALVDRGLQRPRLRTAEGDEHDTGIVQCDELSAYESIGIPFLHTARDDAGAGTKEVI